MLFRILMLFFFLSHSKPKIFIKYIVLTPQNNSSCLNIAENNRYNNLLNTHFIDHLRQAD